MNELMLVILDGWGMRRAKKGNAIKLANPENFNHYWRNHSHTMLEASGPGVGLPRGQIGGSEVGHENMGAGRVIGQELVHLNKLIRSGEFFSNKVLVEAMKKAGKGSLHLMGLLSDGGVHSHITHLYALLEMAKKHKVKNVYVHGFLDGRDVGQKSAAKYVSMLSKKTKKLGVGKLVSLIGRYYAMDRDERWKREHKAYNCLVMGEGDKFDSPLEAIRESYKKGVTDEFFKPTVIGKRGRTKKGDTIIFFNFRSDRARELTRSFVEGEFHGFKRGKGLPVHFVCLTQYDKKIKTRVAFPPEKVKNTIGETLDRQGLKQLRAAETEKYAHVTYFFNGGREKPWPSERRILVPSPRVGTYDTKPEMSAYTLTEKLLKDIKAGKNNVIIINYANCDMVGHTGVLKAGIKAVKTVDECLGKIVEAFRKEGGKVIITADHGNCEIMFYKGKMHTAHTMSPVPFIIVDDKRHKLRKRGNLGNVGPTMLDLLGVKKPGIMAESLIKRKAK